MPKLSLHIVVWNNLSDLSDLFESLENQTYKDFVVRVVDNGSNDGTEKWLQEKYPQVMIIRNSHNLGLAAAHNQAFKFTLSKWSGEDLNHCYIAVIKPDVVLDVDCLENLVVQAEANLVMGSLAPKILKLFQDNQTDEVLKENVCSDIIDSTGLRASRSRRFFERGAGELDQGQFDDKFEIFGANNVFAFYRGSALKSVKHSGEEYFDLAFFDSQLGVDLAWRLLWLGWTAGFVSKAVVHHVGDLASQEKAKVFKKILNFYRRFNKKENLNFIRNHCWLLIKNLPFFDFVFHAPRILLSEFWQLFSVCFFRIGNFVNCFQIIKGLPKMLKKRREIFSQRQVNRRVINRWFI